MSRSLRSNNKSYFKYSSIYSMSIEGPFKIEVSAILKIAFLKLLLFKITKAFGKTC
jgi:hypothetical protein